MNEKKNVSCHAYFVSFLFLNNYNDKNLKCFHRYVKFFDLLETLTIPRYYNKYESDKKKEKIRIITSTLKLRCKIIITFPVAKL